jgi:hypothetical protein
MCQAGLDELVDHYAGPLTREVLFCPAAMRASYAARTWEPIWHDVELREDGTALYAGQPLAENAARWVRNALALNQRGLNPYHAWLARARACSLSPWLSMRMNDIHSVGEPTNFMHSDFWREHPDFQRLPYRLCRWPDAALDYGREEVRARALAQVGELLETFDMAGLELDWMRFGFHFRPGREAEGRRHLTDFVRQVRTLANKAAERLGHAVTLGVRVPARPEFSYELGMDAIRWADEGLVDMVVPTAFWATTDYAMPIALWRRLLPAGVTLGAGLELLTRAYPAAPPIRCTAEMVFGYAANYLWQGADRVYLFNHMDSQTAVESEETRQRILEVAGDLEQLVRSVRRHVVTYTDTVPEGREIGYALPVELKPNEFRELRVPVGLPPADGTVQLLLGLAQGAGAAFQQEVRVNGEPCPPASAPKLAVPDNVERLAAFDVPAGAVAEGDSVVEVRNAAYEPVQIVWAELLVTPDGV